MVEDVKPISYFWTFIRWRLVLFRHPMDSEARCSILRTRLSLFTGVVSDPLTSLPPYPISYGHTLETSYRPCTRHTIRARVFRKESTVNFTHY